MNNQHSFYPKNNIWVLLSAFGLLLLGIILGIITSYLLGINHSKSYSVLRGGGYEYINPLIDFDNIDFIKTKEQKALEENLINFIDNEKENNPKVRDISAYYKDLNSGAWIGINTEEKFAMASLGKVPLMISHYKIAERNPQHLEKSYVYDFVPEYHYGLLEDNRTEGYSLEQGSSYTIDEYINQLIIYSDNTVIPTLRSDAAFQAEEYTVFSSLGLTNPRDTSDENFLTTKDYSTFFRILYNATYLNKEMSSKALELLSKVSYDDGLAKGIPEDIVLANKFGERTLETPEEGFVEQIHDCGIIYHPTRPYILCVMTRGSDQSELQKVISNISSIVYKTVDSTTMNDQEIKELLLGK